MILLLFIVSCNTASSSYEDNIKTGVWTSYDTVSNMHYRLYKYYNNDLVVVNITKDSLECEFYKQYLQPVNK